MADTIRTEAELQALFADNNSGNIESQDLRDFLVSTQVDGIDADHVISGTLDPDRLPLATASDPGAMSAADKTKLDAATPNYTPLTLMMRDDDGAIAALHATGVISTSVGFDGNGSSITALDGSHITTGYVGDDFISESSVTQYLTALGINAGVWVIHTDGTATRYKPSADTNTARGTALQAAAAAAVAGDSIYLGPGTYGTNTDVLCVSGVNVFGCGPTLSIIQSTAFTGADLLSVRDGMIANLRVSMAAVVDAAGGKGAVVCYDDCILVNVWADASTVHASGLTYGFDCAYCTTLQFYNCRVSTAQAGGKDIRTSCSTTKLFYSEYTASKLQTVASGAFIYSDAASILNSLKTVDGSGSGLDGDTLRGTTPSAYGLTLIDDADASTARTTLGVAIGSNVQAYDATLAALASYNTNGIVTQTAADTFVGRTLTGTSNQISVSNGDGVSGNPTLSTPQNIHTAATPTFGSLTLTAGNITATNDVFQLITSGAAAAQLKAGSLWINSSFGAGNAPTNGLFCLGNCGIGSGAESPQAKLDVRGNGGFFRRTSSDVSPFGFVMQKARGVVNGETTVANADKIAAMEWQGYDGATYQECAAIFAIVNGTVSSATVPMDIVFQTSANATGSLAERMRIGSSSATACSITGALAVSGAITGSTINGATITSTTFNGCNCSTGNVSITGGQLFSPGSSFLGLRDGGGTAWLLGKGGVGCNINGPDQYGWSSTTVSGTNDTGLKRNAAAVVEVTNGSSGTGKLIAQGGIAAGVSSLGASAILQADSTTLGFLAPRMTSTQMLAISSPATGLQVYSTTTGSPHYYSGSAWQERPNIAKSIYLTQLFS